MMGTSLRVALLCLEMVALVPLSTQQGNVFEKGLVSQRINSGYVTMFEVTLSNTTQTEVLWYKEDILLNTSGRFEISNRGRDHRLRISDTTLADTGVYSIRVDGQESQADLTVVPPECNADVFIVLDGSDYLGANDFSSLKEVFKQKITSSIDSQHNLRFGILVYGVNVTDIIPLSSNRSAFEDAISVFELAGNRALAHLGIEKAHEILMADRLSTRKYLFLVTSTSTSSAASTARAATAARDDGITVKAIGLVRVLRIIPPVYDRFKQLLSSVASSVQDVYEYDDVSNLMSDLDLAKEVCNMTVDGGWSQWSFWIDQPCQRTCGRDATRMISRSRLCDNPSRRNGGRPCTGDNLETTEVNCGLQHCIGNDLCSEAVRINGVGYNKHKTNCDSFIQCYYNPSGNVIGVYRSCPFGYYWNQKTLRCDEPWRVSCVLDLCNGSCGCERKHEGSCRSYWKCQDSHYEARCCPIGQAFHPEKGCQTDMSCDEDCPISHFDRDACDKRPSFSPDLSTYSQSSGNNWVNETCEQGMTFRVTDCSCEEISEMNCQSYLSSSFESEDNPKWLKSAGTITENGHVYLNASSQMSLDVEILTLSQPVAFSMTFRETPASSGSRILASSSDCGTGQSLLISTNDSGVQIRLKSWLGFVTNMELSTAGMQRYVWKTITVVYNFKYLTGILQKENTKYVSKMFVSEANILECGILIGSDGAEESSSRFEGEIDEISVYKCNPEVTF